MITCGRLHVQAGYERCLFFKSTASVIMEICSDFMIRESQGLPLLMIRLGTSSKNLHKTAKNTSVNTEDDKYSNNDLFGRYTYNGSNDERNSHVQRHFTFPPATVGFCFKPVEVHFEFSSDNRVCWGNNKLFEDVSVFTT